MRTGAAIAATLVLMCLGCGEQPSSQAVQQIVAPELAEQPAAPETVSTSALSLDQLLERNAKKYAKDWTVAAPTIRGQLREGERSDHLLVLRAGFCYRVIGVGDGGVEDLDLLLFDGNGVQVHQDPAQDRFPVLGLQTEICPAAGAAVRLQVVMYKGSGAFVAGVYKTTV
jgi:hypothetical protein